MKRNNKVCWNVYSMEERVGSLRFLYDALQLLSTYKRGYLRYGNWVLYRQDKDPDIMGDISAAAALASERLYERQDAAWAKAYKQQGGTK